MLQIIVWVGCFYLVLKGMEMLQSGLAAPDDNFGARTIGYLGIILGVCGAFLFFWMANRQVSATQNPSFLSSLSGDTTNMPGTYALSGNADEDAEKSLKAADAAVKAADEASNAAENAMRGTK